MERNDLAMPMSYETCDESKQKNLTNVQTSDMTVQKNIDETVLCIKMYSKTRQEELKMIGGDSCEIKMSNNIYFLVDMFDKNDGSYETLKSIPADGNYAILITILQSICEGFMDPPKDYFQKGKVFFCNYVLITFFEIFIDRILSYILVVNKWIVSEEYSTQKT